MAKDSQTAAPRKPPDDCGLASVTRESTPGPWRVMAGGPFYTIEGPGDPALGEHKAAIVADVFRLYDAYQIAASPDMRAALERAEEAIHRYDKRIDTWSCSQCPAKGEATKREVLHYEHCIIHVIRAALAKARGKPDSVSGSKGG